MSEGLKVILGTHAFASQSEEDNREFLKILEKHGVKDLDTASRYPGSEKALGDLGAPAKFTVHTKAPGEQDKNSLLSGAAQSLKDLGVESVETYFLHFPSTTTPLEETLDAIQSLYKQGVFKKFGLSNFQPEQVQKVHDYASSKGYVLPTVYQGNYNPVARVIEQDLIPLLRKLKIPFYCYSPLAGGFLVRSAEGLKNGTGRFDPNTRLGKTYHDLYNRPRLVEALSAWEEIAKEAGISKAELAYRWVNFNSALSPKYGDAIIVGASRPSQLEETLSGLEKGPLSAEIVKKIDKIWEAVKDEAPRDNFTK